MTIKEKHAMLQFRKWLQSQISNARRFSKEQGTDADMWWGHMDACRGVVRELKRRFPTT